LVWPSLGVEGEGKIEVTECLGAVGGGDATCEEARRSLLGCLSMKMYAVAKRG